MMLNKNKEISQLESTLQEVKDAMKSSCDSANTLDVKAHSIINIIISIIFGLSMVIFISGNDKAVLIPAIFLIIGVFISLCFLCLGYKTRKYHLYGDLMKDIEKEDGYYHDKKGMFIYLIKTYQDKTTYNIYLNSIKGDLINKSIIVTIISSLIAVLVYLFLNNFL